MKRLKSLFVMLLAIIAVSLVATVAACKSEPNPSLTVSDEALALYVDETHTLTVDATDINETLLWVSSDPTVIKVEPSEDGKSAVITALQAGDADITVSAGAISDTCSVAVKAITEIQSIEIRYDGSSEPVLKRGGLLDVNKLSSSVSGETLTYRYTVQYGDGAETDLNAMYALSEKGVYTVTAYITSRGYTGSDTLKIKVADELSDLTVTCSLSDPIFAGDVLKTEDVSCSSASVSSLAFGYNIIFPDGGKKAFDADVSLTQAGEYVIEAYIKDSSDWFGSATITINVIEKISLTDKMELTYDGSATENKEHEIDDVFDFSKYSLTISDRPSDVTDDDIVWTLNEEVITLSDASSYMFETVGGYVLTASVEHEYYSGKTSVEILVYENHEVTITGSNQAVVDAKIAYAYSSSQGVSLRLEVSYDGGASYVEYDGSFAQPGKAKMRAIVVDKDGYHRGEANKDVTVYALGSALSVENTPVTLYYGITHNSLQTTLTTLTASVGDASATYFATSDAVTVSGSTVTSNSSGIAEVYAVVANAAYLAYTVTVKDYTGYKAIAMVDDLKAMEQSGNYVMVSDVDLNGHSGKIIDSFGGILDGNGHAIKNGVLPVTNADTGTFIKTLTGTLKNVAFTGFTVNGTKTNWGYKGIIGTVKPTAVIENVFIGMQVEAQAGTDVWCTGVVAGKVENGATVRNIVADVTYTDEFTNWHTLFGDIDRSRSVMQNCYAIAGEYSNKITDSANGGVYTNNFETVEALKDAHPELFAENGAFTGEFWENCIKHINRPVFKSGFEVFVGETFTMQDVFVKNPMAVTVDGNTVTLSGGVFTAKSAGKATLKVVYLGEEITTTVTVKAQTALADVKIIYDDGAAFKFNIGDQLVLSKLVSSAGQVTLDAKYCVYTVTLDEKPVAWTDGKITLSVGTWKIALTVTDPSSGYVGTTATRTFTLSDEIITVENESGDAATINGTLETASGGSYTFDDSTYTLDVTVSSNKGNTYIVSGYRSSNERVATVSENGVITGLSDGTTKIYATVNGQDYKVITITVETSFNGYKAIATVDDLKAMEQSGNYVMVSDVDLNGHSGKIIDSFGGILDGNGHAIKNGVLPVTNADTGTFIKTLTGTLKNVAFTGFTVNGTKTNWGYKGIIGTVKPTAVIENVFIGMQVEAQAGTDVWCTGVVAGKVENGATVRNIVADVTYTDEFTNWHTLFGDIDRSRSVMQNCYAIAGEYSNKITDSANGGVYTNNFETVEALKAAYPELFAENGAFATEFWKGIAL